MSKIWTLTRVMLKASIDEQFNAFKSSKNPKIKSILLYAFLGLYLTGVFLVLGAILLNQLIAIDQAAFFVFLLHFIIQLIVLFFTFFSVPIVMYYSNDNAAYFTMPLRSREIIAAKALTIYLQTLLTSSVVLVPLYGLYLIKTGMSFVSFLMAGLALFLVPILPILITITVIVCLFTFTPFFKSKEVFTYLTTGFAVLISLAASQLSMFVNISSSSFDELYQQLSSGNNTLVTMLTSIFPTTRFLTDAITKPSLISLVLAIIVTAVASGIVLLIVEPLYFKAVLLFTETRKSRRKSKLNQVNKESNRKNMIFALSLYDFKNILRTPAFVFNYYLPYLMVPVVTVFSIYSIITAESVFELSSVRELIANFMSMFSPLDIISYALAGSIIAGTLITNFGSTTITGISREGLNIKEFLMFPLRFSALIKAKVVNSLITALVLPIILSWVIIIVFGLPLYLVIFVTGGLFIGSVLIVYLGAWVDMANPRITWANEQDAIKGNIRQIFVMLPALIIPFMIGYGLIYLQSTFIVLLFGVISIIGSYALSKHVHEFADTKFVTIIQNK